MTAMKYNNDPDYDELYKLASEGIDLIMEHLQDVNGFRLPRKIQTGATKLKQVSVNTRNDILYYFKSALYEDCRINAYPDFEAMKLQNMISQDYKPTPDHLFIDLDRASFDTDEQLEGALQTTLKNIHENIQGYDQQIEEEDNVMVIWSGNGYHVHVSLHWESALEDMPEFANFKSQDLATRLLRWAERELTEGKADQHHNPSIKSCLFRVPGTLNSKAKNSGLDPIVKVIQEKQVEGNWKLDNNRRHLSHFRISKVNKDFLMKFHSHLVQGVIDDKVEKLERRHKLPLSNGPLKNKKVSSIDWIDRLLQTGVEDDRKNLLFWVLAPYLITVRQLNYDKAYAILDSWLDKCDQVKRLEPDKNSFRSRLKNCLDTAENQERKPIKFETFKEYYPDSYKRLRIGGA